MAQDSEQVIRSLCAAIFKKQRAKRSASLNNSDIVDTRQHKIITISDSDSDCDEKPIKVSEKQAKPSTSLDNSGGKLIKSANTKNKKIRMAEITSFFHPIPKKRAKPSTSASDTLQRKIISISDSDSDEESAKIPKKQAKPSASLNNNDIPDTLKHEIINIADSDSESDEKSCKRRKKESVKTNSKKDQIARKYLAPLNAFGNAPVNQNQVNKDSKLKTITNENNNDDFDKTLEQVKTKKAAPQDQRIDENKAAIKKSPQQGKLPKSKRKYSSSEEEVHEKKRLFRSGPVHPGTKWIPKGDLDVFIGDNFSITGVLESLEREEAKTLIREHGGHYTEWVSEDLNYLVVGVDAGPAKIEAAKKYGVEMISEDYLINMICVMSRIPNRNIQTVSSKSVSEEEEEEVEIIIKNATKKVESKENKDANSKESVEVKPEINRNSPENTVEETKVEIKPPKKEQNKDEIEMEESLQYKSKDLNEIICQQGERSIEKKLQNWLESWQKNRARESVGEGIPRPSPCVKDDDGAYFRAALLSGVGKTTIGTLVCKQFGFDTVEFNASDTRNEEMVYNEIAQIIKNTSFSDGSAPTRRHVLLMDEVDEDPGGIQELITLIKQSNIPIICVCNDRQHTKIRTLANYCFDLRFTDPRLEQIRGAMVSTCFKEGVDIKSDVFAHIIEGTEQDISQTMNQLSLYTAITKTTNNAPKLPGHYLEGHFGAQIDFPGWLGKNSKANKFQRMSISGDRTAFGLDYVRCLRDAIANPMLQRGAEGIAASVQVMRSYNLLREALWPKMKAALTRMYNKNALALPYAALGVGAVNENDKGVDDDDASNDADDISNDPMIKAKKEATNTASTSKAEGKGKTEY